MLMNDTGFDYVENDFGAFCGLGDIFPDIEPYLDDYTSKCDIAQNGLDKIKTEGHVDGSDSDSGISADCQTNAIVKNLDLSSNKLLCHEKFSQSDNNTSNMLEDSKQDPNRVYNNKIIKRPITFIGKNGLDIKQNIYNIIPKITSSNQITKSIFLNSHAVCKIFENKDVSKPVSKITPIKLLKSNEGFPVVNDFMMIKPEAISLCDSKNINGKQIKRNGASDKISIVNKDINSCCNLFTSKNSIKDVFFKEDSINTHEDKSLFSNCRELNVNDNTNDSFMDITEIDEFKSSDYQSYIDMLNVNQGNKILPTSLYNNLSNCDGILDAHHYDRMVKKQERMIKNRQAASLSRQRKKEYVERLEHKVEQQKQENHFIQNQINDIRERFSALEQENQLLKRDIQTWRERYYDLERQKIKQGIITSNKYTVKNADINNKSKALKATAASTTILGIFIILTINFNSFNSTISLFYKSQNDKNIPIYENNYPIIPNSHSGKKFFDGSSRISRTLFSIVGNSTDNNSENLGNHICNNTSVLNISETLRLTRELNRWGSRFKAESVKIYDRIQNEKIKSQILNKEIESMYKKSKFRDVKKIKRKRENKIGQLEIYPRNNDYKFFDNFINDIDRKPDTLYFVTFHSDNFIFPASNVNKNLSTPKITLFLPADINQKNKNYYKMMKIDCQVQNFTIVNLKSVKLP